MGDRRDKDGPSQLAADLILGADGELVETELATASDPLAAAPLDPAAFAEAPGSTTPLDPAEAPRVPAPKPRSTSGTSHPWQIHGSAASLPPEAPSSDVPASSPNTEPVQRSARRTPLPTGLGPETDFAGLEQHGIQALPIDAEAAVAPRAPKLPCNLLVAAPDQRVASKRASALMERGYMCRVVSTEALTVAAAEQPYDAIVIELPAAVAERDGGANVIGLLGAVSAPVIVTCEIRRSPVSVESRAHVAAWLEEPFPPEQLVTAIEDSRDLNAEREAALENAEDGMFDLSVNLVRAQVVLAEGGIKRGRVRTMSYQGKLSVDMHEPLPIGTKLTARFRTVEGQRQAEAPGQVLNVRGTASIIQLDVPEAELEPIRIFVDEARNVTTPQIEQVVIRARIDRATSMPGSQPLLEHWARVKDNIEDDEAQQAFIKSCLETKQIEFAVRCYRELKEVNPEDERVQKYLNQVGTILGFYAFRKDAAAQEDSSKMPMMLKVGLGLFITLALTLWVLVELLA